MYFALSRATSWSDQLVMDLDTAIPQWAAEYSLQPCGEYFEGFVDDHEVVRSHHTMATVTSYGVRKSRHDGSSKTPDHSQGCDLKQVQIVFRDIGGTGDPLTNFLFAFYLGHFHRM